MLTAKTILAALWSTSSRFLTRIIDFAILLVLARLLSPADFGLTALAVSVVAITETLLEVPLVQALTGLRTVSKTHLDTSFTVNLLRSAVIVAVLAVVAWPLSIFYVDPQLELLVMILSLGPVARSMVSPRLVELIRAMQFRQIFFMEVGGKFVAAVLAVSIAFAGGGYWAIVANSVSSPVAVAVLSYVIAPYRPAFSLGEWSSFRAFVGWFSLSQMLSAMNWQIDRMIVGRFVSKPEFGQYTMASDISVLPTQTLIGPAMSPLMAALSQIGDDPDRLRAAYLKSSSFVLMVSVPASVGISLTAHDLTAVLLGPKWAMAADFIRWIPLTFVFAAYVQPLGALAFILRRPDTVFRLNFIDFCIRLASIPVMTYLFLIPGLLAARGVIAVVVFGMSLFFARQLSGAGVVEQLLNLWKVAAGVLVMAVAVLAFQQFLLPDHWPAIFRLGTSAALGAASYGAMLLLLGVDFNMRSLRST